MERKRDKKKPKRLERSRDKEEERTKNNLNIFQKLKNNYHSKGLTKLVETDSSILDKYDDLNEKYLNILGDENLSNKYTNIISINLEKTEKEKAKAYGERLFSSLSTNPSKKDKTTLKPNLSYNKRLSDEEFLDLVDIAKEYAFQTKTNEEIGIIKNEFERNKKYIIELFDKSRIIKDILENAILSVLINEYSANELSNNFNYLTIDDASP